MLQDVLSKKLYSFPASVSRPGIGSCYPLLPAPGFDLYLPNQNESALKRYPYSVSIDQTIQPRRRTCKNFQPLFSGHGYLLQSPGLLPLAAAAVMAGPVGGGGGVNPPPPHPPPPPRALFRPPP